MRATGLVDVDVVTDAVRREELDPELREERVEPRLIRGDPLAAQLVRLASDLGVPKAASHTAARLQHDDLAPGGDELARGREPGDSRADDCDVRLDLLLAHVAPLIRRRAPLARPRGLFALRPPCSPRPIG